MDLTTLNNISFYIDKAWEILMESLDYPCFYQGLDSPRSYIDHTILIKVEEARLWVQEAECRKRMENDLDHDDT
jgi:hypothetical protein